MFHLFQKPSHFRLFEAHIYLPSEASFGQESVDFVYCFFDLADGLVTSYDAATQQLAAEEVVLSVLLELAKSYRHCFQIEAKLCDCFGRIPARVVEPLEFLCALQELHREGDKASATGHGAEDLCHCNSVLR